MKKLTPSLKRQITKDWSELFPGMGIYKPLHLLRRVGPMLEGILLERDSSKRSYRPTFHVQNLMQVEEFPSIMLTLAQPLRTNRTRAPDTIDVQFHESKFREAAERLHRQCPLAVSGDLELDDVLAAYRRWADSANWDDHLYEDMALYCAWVGRQSEAKAIIEEGQSQIESWPAYIRRKIPHWREWGANLTRLCDNRSDLQRTVDEEIKALKVQDLPTSDLKA